jgi:murein L,D-transpeptidase YafK
MPLSIDHTRTEPVRIVVYKSERLLQLWRGALLAAQFRISLGFAPQGHKQAEGDGKTPEGAYYICMRNEKSRFYKSLGLSYPNAQDAKNGLNNGLIDEATHDAIIHTISEGNCPPWHTALGGEICIHGHGAAGDWTKGCIALDNEAMDALWALCPAGTAVVILP